MLSTQILIGLVAVISVGVITFFALRGKRKKGIPEVVIDEIRRTLWEKGSTPTNFRMMSMTDGFKHFGIAAMPNAAYQDNYFVEVTATNENGQEEVHLAHITLAFEKDVIESKYKISLK